MDIQLEIITGADAGRTSSFSKQEIIIGRQSGNDLNLNDQAVSGQHCMITVEGETAYVTDMKSSNGTFVNDRLVKAKVPLFPGDQIRVGATVFRVNFVQEQVVTAAASPSQQSSGVPASSPKSKKKLLIPAILIIGVVLVGVYLLLRSGGVGVDGFKIDPVLAPYLSVYSELNTCVDTLVTCLHAPSIDCVNTIQCLKHFDVSFVSDVNAMLEVLGVAMYASEYKEPKITFNPKHAEVLSKEGSIKIEEVEGTVKISGISSSGKKKETEILRFTHCWKATGDTRKLIKCPIPE